jgi:hypothetical protein
MMRLKREVEGRMDSLEARVTDVRVSHAVVSPEACMNFCFISHALLGCGAQTGLEKWGSGPDGIQYGGSPAGKNKKK